MDECNISSRNKAGIAIYWNLGPAFCAASTSFLSLVRFLLFRSLSVSFCQTSGPRWCSTRTYLQTLLGLHICRSRESCAGTSASCPTFCCEGGERTLLLQYIFYALLICRSNWTTSQRHRACMLAHVLACHSTLYRCLRRVFRGFLRRPTRKHTPDSEIASCDCACSMNLFLRAVYQFCTPTQNKNIVVQHLFQDSPPTWPHKL